MKKEKKFRQDRKPWFRFIKWIMRVRYKRVKFINLGEELKGGSIILSNHEGTDAPLSLELYSQIPVRFWGAYEMNSRLIDLYRYQTKIYYHQKKHWPLFIARVFCLLASPLTYIFYKGLNLISTYPDARFAVTIKQSIKAIENGESIVIFPEDSSEGYQKELKGFFPGFAKLADVLYTKRGIDVPIYVTYLKKSEHKYMIDAPIYYSELIKNGETPEEIARVLVERCNIIGNTPEEKLLNATDEADSKESQISNI